MTIQNAQNMKPIKKKVTKGVENYKKLSTLKMAKTGKKRVIHEVMHIIHMDKVKKFSLHSKKIECVFCVEIIKIS